MNHLTKWHWLKVMIVFWTTLNENFILNDGKLYNFWNFAINIMCFKIKIFLFRLSILI